MGASRRSRTSLTRTDSRSTTPSDRERRYPEIRKQRVCSVVAWHSGNLSAWMGAGAAEVQASNRSTVVSPARKWAGPEHLASDHVQVANVAVESSPYAARCRAE